MLNRPVGVGPGADICYVPTESEMSAAKTKYEKLFAVYEDFTTAIADVDDPLVSSLCSSWKSTKGVAGLGLAWPGTVRTAGMQTWPSPPTSAACRRPCRHRRRCAAGQSSARDSERTSPCVELDQMPSGSPGGMFRSRQARQRTRKGGRACDIFIKNAFDIDQEHAYSAKVAP